MRLGLSPEQYGIRTSLFTDFGYETVAIPRNRRISRNDDKDYFDLGLCERHDARTHTDEERFCGSFRTPSLRNVAVRDLTERLPSGTWFPDENFSI